MPQQMPQQTGTLLQGMETSFAAQQLQRQKLEIGGGFAEAFSWSRTRYSG